MRVPIKYTLWRGFLLRAAGIWQRWSYVDVGPNWVRVRMAYGFSARIRRSNIAEVTRDDRSALSTGVHGWRGRWLVNGAGPPFVAIRFGDDQRAFVLGVAVHVRELLVSVDDPEALIAALA